MREIKPAGLHEIDFTPYGRWYELRAGKRPCRTESREALERPYKLGITKTGAGSFDSAAMERHVSTEEVLFALDAPLVLVAADSSPCGAPQAEDLIAVRIEPGQVVVLGRGIWHDACRCAGEKNSMYCFLAHNNGEPSELAWTEIFPEKVRVQVEDCPEIPLQPETAARPHDHRIPGGTVHDVLETEKITGPGWECWQTETVCIPAKLDFTFVEMRDGETYEIETSPSGAFVIGASGQIEVRTAANGQNGLIHLTTGRFLQAGPGISCTMAAPGGGSFYLLTTQSS